MAITIQDLGGTVRKAGYVPILDWQAGIGETIKFGFTYSCGHRDELVLIPALFATRDHVTRLLDDELGRECPNCTYADFIAAWKARS